MRRHVYDVNPEGLVWDAWKRHADETPDREAIVHVALEAEPLRWRWAQLLRSASRAARWLEAQGVQRGEVCALIVRHHPYFYPLYLGISALGAMPSVLAYPNARLHADKFRHGLVGMSQRSGLDHILTEPDLVDVVSPLVGASGSTIRDVLCPLEALAGPEGDGHPIVEHAPATADEACLLQHSSGTTGLQKPVVLSHRALLEHARRYGESIQLTENDRVASWLPLYHDMGLIAAFYLPLICGVPLVQLSPLEWVLSPAMLPRAISDERATLCWLPNFAYNFMADRIREEDLQGVSLESLRLVVNCSEPVRADSHDRFHRRFAPYGLRSEALGACYAMAETTFAVTQTAPVGPARRLSVDRAELSRGVVVLSAGAAARQCVSSGKPIAGCTVRILDEEGHELPEGRVGDIAISSVSLFDGYRNYPEKTLEVLEDGWYKSGDYGFVSESECYVIGRRKDVIIVAGNNVFPEDIEDAVARVPGVIPGRIVAFGVEDEALGTEVLCVLAETEAESDGDKRALRVAVKQAGMGIDLTISRVYLVPPRWLIKSSSGKLARATNKARALGELSWK